jgi:hypothetical protein
MRDGAFSLRQRRISKQSLKTERARSISERARALSLLVPHFPGRRAIPPAAVKMLSPSSRTK